VNDEPPNQALDHRARSEFQKQIPTPLAYILQQMPKTLIKQGVIKSETPAKA